MADVMKQQLDKYLDFAPEKRDHELGMSNSHALDVTARRFS